MAEGIEVKPGFFGLPLGLFQSKAYELYQIRINSCHGKLLHSRTHGMDAAIYNLLGMLYYSMRQVGNALEAFQHALDIDPDDLNALENIRHIYELQGRTKDAAAAHHRLQPILPDPLVQARCLAEQGYALVFGSVDDDCIERWKQSAQYYRQAITLAETKAEPKEIANWYLCIAINMQKICDKLFIERESRETEYTECMEACLKAYQLTKGDNLKSLHAMSLRILGTLKSKARFVNCKKVNMLVKKYNANIYYDNPEESFKKAMKLDPDNPESYARYAKVLFRRYCYDKIDEKQKQESYETAMDLLNRFIGNPTSFDEVSTISGTDPLSVLWFPLVTRGRIYLQMYRYKHDTSVENLHNAYKDFTWALKIKRSAHALAELGEVCQLIAMHPFTALPSRDIQVLTQSERKEYTKYMNGALTRFLDATLCMEGDKKSYIHQRYAVCLADYGEHRTAVETFKRALELKDVAGTALKSFKGLVKSINKLYEEDRHPDLMAELAIWLDNIVFMYEKQREKVAKTVELMFRDHISIMKEVLYQLAYWRKSETLKMCLAFHDDPVEEKKLLALAQHVPEENSQLANSEKSQLSALAEPWFPISEPPSIKPSNPPACPQRSGNQIEFSAEASLFAKLETDHSGGVDELLMPAESLSIRTVQSEIKADSKMPGTSREQSPAPAESNILNEIGTMRSRVSANLTLAPTGPTQTPAGPVQAIVGPIRTSTGLIQTSADPAQTSSDPTKALAGPTQTPTGLTQASAGLIQVAADPAQTSADPTQASADPTQASADPTQASADPTQASADPTQASADPTQASADPTQASADPTQASADPTQASADPTQASADPTQALTGPIQTSADPTQASAGPIQTSADPTQALTGPIQTSADPTQALTGPTQTSADPTQASADPTQASTNPTQTSADPTQASADPTQASTNPTQESAGPTQATADPTQASADPTQATTGPSPSAGQTQVTTRPMAEEEYLTTGEVCSPDMPYNELLQYIPQSLSEAKNQHGKTYDFFVSFSSKDAEWVYHSLLPKCEKQSRFKGCIADRDYPLGKSIFDNMEWGFNNSVCTILVITPNFVDSYFCKHELDQVLLRARQNRHRMIPIKLGECDVPPAIAALTYLDATGHVDWDRLIRNLDSYCNK